MEGGTPTIKLEKPDTPTIKLEKPDTPSPTKPATKSRYSSCLSSFRNNYKPPANFTPSNISSPKFFAEDYPPESNTSSSRGIPSLLGVSIGPPCTPVNSSRNGSSYTSASSPRDVSFIDISAPSPFKDEVKPPNMDSYVSLTGTGGEWRGPNQSDMTPENKSRRQFYRGSGFKNSRGAGDSYGGGMNSSTPNQSFGRNSRDGNSSFNSSQGRSSPYISSERYLKHRSMRHRKDSFVDISTYYSPEMTVDPWFDLVMKKNSQDNKNLSQNQPTRYQ